jgi:hypothetical protein
VIELASDAQFARDLAAGGVFVPGCGLPLAEECDLLVCGANRELLLPARVVYVDAYRGAGLELIGFSAELKARLAALEPINRPGVEVIDEPVVEDSAFDRGTLDDPPPIDDDDAGDALAESVAVIDIDALADASGDDLALPIVDTRAITGTLPPWVVAARDELDPGATLTFDAEAMARTPTVDLQSFVLGRSSTTDTNLTAAAVLARASTIDVGANADAADDAYAYALARTETVDAERHAEASAAPSRLPDGDPGATLSAALAADDAALDALVRDGVAQAGDGPATAEARASRARSLQEHLRGLTLAAQHRIAATGELHERILIERLYGKNVWDPLLRNPRLTAPEVSRIARYGALPRVLLELIVGNSAWLQAPEVRRALLANPRLGSEQIAKVLRLTPKHELKLATTQTAYPQSVRIAAKQLMTRGE